MAQLVVRNLPDDVKHRLRRRASLHGRSLEGEVRAILMQASESADQGDDDKGLGSRLAESLLKIPLSEEAWAEFDRGLREVRLERMARPPEPDLFEE